MDTIGIAKVCHEVNRAYCMVHGDVSQVPWDLAPDWQRQSAVAGVEAIKADPEMKASELHQCWMEQKAADGWIFGETKNAQLKTHPCMVPYEDLPVEQRVKDHLFRAIVRNLADTLPAKGSISGR